MALLELLAGAAPARIVATELLVCRRDDRSLRRGGGRAPDAECCRACRRRCAGSGDRLRARGRLVLVREIAVLRLLGLVELGGLGRRDLRVEEREHDLL